MQFVTFLLALLPIIWLIVALSGLKWPGYRACPVAFLIAVVLAVGIWKMRAMDMVTASLEGALTALWPICLVIVAAMFTYNLTLKTKAMDTIKRMLTSVSNDKRVLILIIAWGFGCFMEGMAGFGTAVAIPASMLAGLGFDPIFAAVVCLVANTTPTAFGSVGIPTVTLSAVTGMDVGMLSNSTALIQLPLMILTPFIMVAMSGRGLKALKGMIPTTLISSLSFALPAYLAAHFIGAELPDIFGSICCMVCTIIAAKLFNKKVDPEYAIIIEEEEAISKETAIKAWMPFILIFVLLMLTSKLVGPINTLLSQFKSSFMIYSGENAAATSFSWINTPGIWILLSAFLGGAIQGASFGEMFCVLKNTLISMWKTILTICSVLATAKLMSYSGMISDIAAFLVAATGGFYPLIAPVIGAIGAFVTGSGTSTTVLFGGLQAQTAEALGMSASWLAATNTMGAGIGKILCPQSMAISVGAINMPGKESEILKRAFPYFVFDLVLAGIVCYIGAVL